MPSSSSDSSSDSSSSDSIDCKIVNTDAKSYKKKNKSSKSSKSRHENKNKHSSSKTTTAQFCGPALPPHLLKNQSTSSDKPICGPELPLNLIQKSNTDDDLEANNKSPEIKVCGPVLPPHLQKEKNVICGPELPPHLKNLSNEVTTEDASEKTIIGPSIPEHLRQQLENNPDETELCEIQNEEESSDESDDAFGPLPPEMTSKSKAHVALEERALLMKLGQLNPEIEKKSREEWMIELPEVQAANLGLGPRQFRNKAGPDLSDRSSWTTTPNSNSKPKAEKVDLKQEAEEKALRRRDKEQEEMAKNANKTKKRDKSLYDCHQENLKKQKKDDGEEQERKPFNRETDLQVNRFDEAQKKAIMKKAQLLDDRFSQGKSKYL